MRVETNDRTETSEGRPRRWHRLLVALTVLAVLSAACSNADDGDEASDTTTTEAADDTAAPDEGDDTAAPDEGDDTTADDTTADDTAGDDTGSPDNTPGDGQFEDLEFVEVPSPCPEIPGVDETTIKVGTLIPTSGARALSFGSSVSGIEARIRKANEEGELGDRTIELVAFDDASDAARNAEGARTLIEQDGVYGIIEVSDQSDGSADYLRDNEIPVAGWHVGRGHWGTHENFFAFRLPGAAFPEEDHTDRTAKIVQEFGGTNVAIVGGGNDSSVAFVEREAASAEAAGLEVGYSTTDVVSGDTNFIGIVQRIEESGADSLITGLDTLQNTALSQQIVDAGLEMKVVIFPGGYDPRVTELPGIEGATFGLEFYPFESEPPQFAEFDEWLTDEDVRGQIPYIGWLSAEMFIQGLKEAGLECPTREAFITNLRLIDDWDGNGAFDPVNIRTGFGPPFQCVFYVQVENAEFVPQFDGEGRCGELIKLNE